jgi:hypothetical protein
MAALELEIMDGARAITMTPTMALTTTAVIPSKLERSPCNWSIVSTGGDQIIARSRLGDYYEGSLESFNDLLRF